MDTAWPKEITEFEAFLDQAGLACQRREASEFFGDRLLQYGSAAIGVRIASDRGIWDVLVADLSGAPDEWYDAAILRDLVLGSGEGVLPLADQIDFVEGKWPAIVRCIDSVNARDSHARLGLLENERVKRPFPGIGR